MCKVKILGNFLCLKTFFVRKHFRMVIQRRKWRNESWIQGGKRRRPCTSPIPCQTRFPQRLFVLFARVPTKDNAPRLKTSQKTERSVSISTAHWRHFGNWKLELDQKSEVGSGPSRPQYPLDHPVLLVQLFISLQPAHTITYVSVSFQNSLVSLEVPGICITAKMVRSGQISRNKLFRCI